MLIHRFYSFILFISISYTHVWECNWVPRSHSLFKVASSVNTHTHTHIQLICRQRRFIPSLRIRMCKAILMFCGLKTEEKQTPQLLSFHKCPLILLLLDCRWFPAAKQVGVTCRQWSDWTRECVFACPDTQSRKSIIREASTLKLFS